MHLMGEEEMMATPRRPLAGDAETDIDSPEIHDIPLRDLETGEVTDLIEEEEEEREKEEQERGDLAAG
jgi:hypothetical protein